LLTHQLTSNSATPLPCLQFRRQQMKF